jgi:2,3-bisphosphoglycerate-independent phosphoglycerate mutase
VLDGWGIAPDGPGNAISLADTPVFDALWSSYPHSQLIACGRAVGLPEGQMGNSEVGHMNLGAGAVVMQDLTRIDEAATSGGFESNEVLRSAFSDAERVHLIGLVSDGGVHSGFQHLEALIRMAASLEVPDLVLHAFTDGRDTLPHSGVGYLETVQGWMEDAGAGRIGSVVGRYWAMDRDKRWDRTQRAYDLLVHGRAEHRAASGAEAAREAYERDETDEFITPVLVGDAEACIRPGDSVFAFNFRPDRMRQISRALAEPGFDEIDRGGADAVERYATMTQYEEDFDYPVAFAPAHPSMTLPKALGQRGVKQLHVAETEKYAHVTYFFSCGEEEPYPGERRELVPSNREVPTYDHAPEMSAPQAARAFVEAWREDSPTFGIINFANSDMVGHTGVIDAAVKGIETVDACLGEVVAAVHESGGACLITADHGNADHMLEDDGSPNTAHSLNPVPVIVTVSGLTLRDGGILADVAPTILQMLGIEQPEAMTGRSLIDD